MTTMSCGFNQKYENILYTSTMQVMLSIGVSINVYGTYYYYYYWYLCYFFGNA